MLRVSCGLVMLVLLICNIGLTSALAQSPDLDVDLTNKNFKDMLGFRLNNFPKPDYVKNTRAAFNNNRLGFDIRFISIADYEKRYKSNGITTNPFVSDSKVVYIILHDAVINKVVAALDRGHMENDNMGRAIDLALLTNEFVFETISETQRRDVLSSFAKISKMPEEKTRNGAVVAVFKKYFSPYKAIRYFMETKLRYKEVHPEESLLETLRFILGKDLTNGVSIFMGDLLFEK